jgi:Ca2+-binding EF-hand superfamily protein
MSLPRLMLILCLGTTVLAGLASAERVIDQTAPGKSAPAQAGDSSDDVRDVLLMLDEGPLHLRFHVTISGISLSAARNAYVDRLMQTLDTDGDGKLSPEEAARSPLLTTPRRGSANAFLNSLDGARTVGRKELMTSVERVGREIIVYQENASASNNDKEVFKFLDADGSGFLDRSEMTAAATKILERDQDQDECISFQEFLPAQEPDPNGPLALLRPGSEPPAVPSHGEMLRDISETLLPGRLIKKYDKNRDNKLTAEELGWEPERVKMLDANGDGKLTLAELKGIAQTPVDLELAVDLEGAAEGQSPLVVLATAGNRVDDARRPDVLRLVFPKASLTFSFRKIDPVKAAIDNAMRTFNALDVDGNGYLDGKETAMSIRFQRGLFDMLDADSDGKIFGEEMEKYVTVRGVPAATSARVNVYDTGRGFFEALDTNGDGRLSMREMKAATKSLQKMARRNADKLSPEDPVRNFHIEFVRGYYELFRPTDQMMTQTPSFERPATAGPIWFQRMDRNNDGDLTWNEFLGPREVFHRIDKDGDGLIDPQEAAAATEE